MYKNYIRTLNGMPCCVPKILLVMRLTTILLILGVMQVSASGFAQKVTLSEKSTTLNLLFKEIRKQTGYNVFWERDLLKKTAPIRVNFKDTPLQKVMEKCLEGTNLTYVIQDNTIVIQQKEQSVFDKVIDYLKMSDVKGRVIDENDKPLPGATVRVKGTTKMVLTNTNGEFLLKDVQDNAALTISYLGYEEKEIGTNGTAFLAIRLVPSSQSLDQVSIISTGYQTLKKSQLTGAYATINRSTYQQTVPADGNIIGNLEGRLAGLMLNVNQSRDSWSDPGNTSPFVIRGVSTFQAIKKPLIVLNGYPTEVDIESINPYDIESVTILKDAASAAIYGVRASNGVVVINTRKGVLGRPKVNFTTALTYKPKPNYNKLNLLKGRGFIDFESSSALNDIENNFNSKDYIDMVNGTYTPVFSITDDLYNGKITKEEADKLYGELAAYDNTEDYKKIFLQNQVFQSYDMNVSGGGANSTYFFGVNHQNNKGSERFSGFNKTNINYRGTFELSKRINLDVQAIYSTSNSKRVNVPGYTEFKPYQRFLAADGSPIASYFAPFNENYYGFGTKYGTISAARNQENIALGLYDEMYYPYQEMFESSTNFKSDVYRAQGNLKYNLLSGLNLEVGGVYERELDKMIRSASENAYETRIMLNYFAKEDPITGRPIFNIPQGGTNKTENSDITSYTLRAQLAYNKLIGQKHDLSFLAGIEQRKNTSSSHLNTLFGYNANSLTIKPADLSLLGNSNYIPDYTDIMVSGLEGFAFDQTMFEQFFKESYSDDRFVSYYANGAYTYNDKYTVTGSLRIDQSNLFGEDPKFRYTPLWSSGLSWNIRNENFMKDVKWMDELKLRVAAGYNGNIKKGSGPFNLLTSYVNNYVPNPLVGYAISAPRNNELRWEKTFNFNTGLDFGLFNNRLAGSVDYYIKRGKDIFSQIESDPTKGFTNLLTNNASIENKGVDLNISSLNVKGGNFSWRTQVTASFNKSKVLKVKNTYWGFYNFTRAGGAENIEGHPMNSVLTLDYIGLNEFGQPMVRDEHGNPVVLSFSQQVDVPLSALKFAGVNDPKYAIGFNNQFGLGDFSLSALLMYYGGHVGLIKPPSVFDERPQNGAQNFWKKPGDEAFTNIPGYSGAFGTPQYIGTRQGYDNGQQFVRKLDFVALRNITLTYNLKDKAVQKLGLSNTKFILQVQNPGKYVFSGNDIDPETLNFVSGSRGLPLVPSFTFSLSTNF
ncbi:MAG: SusC/RagA family TonB-linked outer membrane protein [Candidatus Pedobacter colombiensis]|uniref:SusC/RagA family TonB-linked outer membrane protein n=1 Tax=Candidatus Pedobacter colombiensis TaxID=3121371 RepID=A0AAJ5W7I3_9SPHI|nr:SusC/RagA family TonB-linked outer membrane protein [Pedobacter sp.]WEK18583.1 MAG: SusC/RagA family TonB-linked outer membrane protein [Pedobacter sp.]